MDKLRQFTGLKCINKWTYFASIRSLSFNVRQPLDPIAEKHLYSSKIKEDGISWYFMVY